VVKNVLMQQEFKRAQAKSLHFVLDDKSFNYPIVTSAELVRLLYSAD
jgi:hypothetical protein